MYKTQNPATTETATDKTFIVISNLKNPEDFAKEFNALSPIDFSSLTPQFHEYIGVVNKFLTPSEKKQIKEIVKSLKPSHALENSQCQPTKVILRTSSEPSPHSSDITSKIEALFSHKLAISLATDGIDSAHIIRGQLSARQFLKLEKFVKEQILKEESSAIKSSNTIFVPSTNTINFIEATDFPKLSNQR